VLAPRPGNASPSRIRMKPAGGPSPAGAEFAGARRAHGSRDAPAGRGSFFCARGVTATRRSASPQSRVRLPARAPNFFGAVVFNSSTADFYSARCGCESRRLHQSPAVIEDGRRRSLPAPSDLSRGFLFTRVGRAAIRPPAKRFHAGANPARASNFILGMWPISKASALQADSGGCDSHPLHQLGNGSRSSQPVVTRPSSNRLAATRGATPPAFAPAELRRGKPAPTIFDSQPAVSEAGRRRSLPTPSDLSRGFLFRPSVRGLYGRGRQARQRSPKPPDAGALPAVRASFFGNVV
jgi:hypothetical protein